MTAPRSEHSPSPPIRLGIIGTGWGANHARVATELRPWIEVRALCSRRWERLAPLGAELGLPAAALVQEWTALVTREDVDLVVITAPDYLHHPMALAAVSHGKHVFCDKPLAMNAAQAIEMLAAAERHGRQHFTGFTWRFAPPFATMRRLIQAGAIGDVRFLDGHFRIGPPVPGKEWQFDPAARAGGVLGNVGVHLIDLARWLVSGGDVLPEPPGNGWRVWARCDAVERPPAPDAGSAANDVVWLHLDFGSAHAPPSQPPAGGRQSHAPPSAGGRQSHAPPAAEGRQSHAPPSAGGRRVQQARLQASQLLSLRAPDPVRFEVHGTEATLIGYANPLAPETQRVDLVRRTSQPPEPVQPLDFPGGPPAPPAATLPSAGLLRPTLRHLYEAHIIPRIQGTDTPPLTPTFRDGWIAQRVLDAALRSAESGTWEVV